MSLQDNIFSEDVENDITIFVNDETRKRVLVFPPVNNYRRYLIHQVVQDKFEDLLHTFSIGEGYARRTVVCYKSDVIREPKLNGGLPIGRGSKRMGVEGQYLPSDSPEHSVQKQRQIKSVPTAAIYLSPAARRGLIEQRPPTDSTPKRDPKLNGGFPVGRESTRMGVEGQCSPAVSPEHIVRKQRGKSVPTAAIYLPPAARRSKIEQESMIEQRQPTDYPSNRDQKLNGGLPTGRASTRMGVEGQCSPAASPEHTERKQRPIKSLPTAAIYLPPAARKSKLEQDSAMIEQRPQTDSTPKRTRRQRRPDRALYIPRHQREIEESISLARETQENHLRQADETVELPPDRSEAIESWIQNKYTEYGIQEEDISSNHECWIDKAMKIEESLCFEQTIEKQPENPKVDKNGESTILENNKPKVVNKEISEETLADDVKKEKIEKTKNTKKTNENLPPTNWKNLVSNVLIISEPEKPERRTQERQEVTPVVIDVAPLEKKVKKIIRPKSKPAPPPEPLKKINRDECDWESLFDDNGDCLDPTLVEELTDAVGEVMIEQPKSDYKAFSRTVEVDSDEFAHVVEIYNFPSEFKTCDLVSVFSAFKNGGFEFKWVDATHCLGVFSSPLVAAEVLAIDHPFVKTRPLSEATALSKSKARRSSEFLQPYEARPETCAALARRLITRGLGVRLATSRQEREQEIQILQEAKEKKRLANKQREDAWEGIIASKPSS